MKGTDGTDDGKTVRLEEQDAINNGTGGAKARRTQVMGVGPRMWTSRTRPRVSFTGVPRENKHPGGGRSTRVSRKEELDRTTEGVLEYLSACCAREPEMTEREPNPHRFIVDMEIGERNGNNEAR